MELAQQPGADALGRVQSPLVLVGCSGRTHGDGGEGDDDDDLTCGGASQQKVRREGELGCFADRWMLHMVCEMQERRMTVQDS